MARKPAEYRAPAALADGREFRVRVTPKAASESVRACDDGRADLLVSVTAAPDGGKANRAVTALLARALGVPKSRLQLMRGAQARDKVFRVRGG